MLETPQLIRNYTAPWSLAATIQSDDPGKPESGPLKCCRHKGAAGQLPPWAQHARRRKTASPKIFMTNDLKSEFDKIGK